MNPPSQSSSALLRVAVAALVVTVLAADFLVPLGIAVWVFYALPLGLSLFSREPALPLIVAAIATAGTVLSLFFDPFDTSPVVEEWVGLTNRSMYVATLWPFAFMVRRLIVVRATTEREAWLRSTQATVLESLQGGPEVNELAKRVIDSTVRAVGAEVGALYLERPSGELERVAAHALDGEGTPARFGRGEGLIGEVAAGGPIRRLERVPEGFLRLQAGIGAGAPASVTVAPLRGENRTVAVLALGALRGLPAEADELLERLSEPIAGALSVAQVQARVRELLDESQRQGEELRSQQAELEAQQAELEATNEELNQTNALMEVQTQELERHRDELVDARRAAETASRYKSEFLANMSHELRTPLNSSLILARLLADNKQGNLDEDQVRSAETIYSAGNDLLVLINDILDLAKVEAGHAEVRAETLPLARVVEALERQFRPVANEKGLGLRITVAANAPREMLTDARRLEQILKNLLSNAFKFTEQGEVELAIGREGHDRIRFAVRDTGIGIAESQQAVIFEAFRQADGTTSRKYGGTGLGLSISRELARLLGGEITVSSSVGRGSTFSFTLPVEGDFPEPRAIADAPAKKARPSARVDSRPPTNGQATRAPSPGFPDDRAELGRRKRLILVIEDDTAFARILYDLAHELDFDCVVAATADEGIALARELVPSGVLLDVGLPDASGLSVLERLKRDPATRHVPIHMLSVSDNTQTALELGAIGYALKPVAREELVKAIHKLEAQHARAVRRVLLVEDDVRQQESLKKLLSAEDVELTVAGTVKEALAELEKHGFDCMVLDLVLPDGSGHDLLESMAAGTRYSFPPVIVYTGREIARADEQKLRAYSRSIIVKGARSPERLLDEVTLFLHRVESDLPLDQRRMLADARQRDSQFEGRKILVVEDDVRNIFALTRLLEPRGAKIEIARNGREALDVLERTTEVDLVLMDLMMPEMDGLTAIGAIRKRSELKRLPIIALTAKAMSDDREQALAAGANDYMAKPFDVDKLVSLCRVWLPR
jgi:signal transduction histidine kinase/DNA-binding response OmpR family regulator